jgi:D-xylose reductase
LKENMSVFDFHLSEDEMKAITALDCNKRYNDPGNYAEPAFGCFYPIFD